MTIIRVMLLLFVVLSIVQSVTIHLLDENLEVADLIITATEHQRDKARQRAQMLEAEIIEQNKQCTDQPPRAWRGPYYMQPKPQQKQEDTPPVSC